MLVVSHSEGQKGHDDGNEGDSREERVVRGKVWDHGPFKVDLYAVEIMNSMTHRHDGLQPSYTVEF